MRTTMPELTVYLRLLGEVYPLVSREMMAWKAKAQAIPDPELRFQALSSLARKRFHCVGGATLALLHRPRLPDLVKAIVATQTISDYLDNLCDRAKASASFAQEDFQGLTAGPEIPEAPDTGDYAAALHHSGHKNKSRGYAAYMLLHEAFRCALDPGRQVQDYYGLYPITHPRGDGGYLSSLVEESRSVIVTLPGYGFALPGISRMALRYSELQSIKHLSPCYRDELMREWSAARWGEGDRTWCGCGPGCAHRCEPLKWWEFGAAAGSTLGIFGLMCGSADTKFGDGDAAAIEDYYFPSVCALHILLDYLIDLGEDEVGGDLNFVARYPSMDAAVLAMERFVREALAGVSQLQNSRPGRGTGRRGKSVLPAETELPGPAIHTAVIRGLLAMYLSDSKVARQGMGQAARRLLLAGGGLTPLLSRACGGIRRVLGF